MDFNGKTILITGASTGIGRALAEGLAEHDCTLILIARRPELIDGWSRELSGTKAQIHSLRCDVGDKNSVAECWEEIVEKFEAVDVAILNAGIGKLVDVKNYSSKTAEDIFKTNVFGIIYWVERLLPTLLKRKRGMIVGISSLADSRGHSGSGFYCASKAAATIYLDGLRAELVNFGIQVVTVKPGFVDTPLTQKNKFKMPFLMSPEKASKIILNGLRREKKVIQFPIGSVLGSKLIGIIPTGLYTLIAKKKFKTTG